MSTHTCPPPAPTTRTDGAAVSLILACIGLALSLLLSSDAWTSTADGDTADYLAHVNHMAGWSMAIAVVTIILAIVGAALGRRARFVLPAILLVLLQGLVGLSAVVAMGFAVA